MPVVVPVVVSNLQREFKRRVYCIQCLLGFLFPFKQQEQLTEYCLFSFSSFKREEYIQQYHNHKFKYNQRKYSYFKVRSVIVLKTRRQTHRFLSLYYQRVHWSPKHTNQSARKISNHFHLFEQFRYKINNNCSNCNTRTVVMNHRQTFMSSQKR